MGWGPGQTSKANGELKCEAGKLRQTLICMDRGNIADKRRGLVPLRLPILTGTSWAMRLSPDFWDALTDWVGRDHSKGKPSGLGGHQ